MSGNGLPTGWRETTLGDLAEIAYGKNLATKKFLNEGYPVFGANGVIGHYNEYHYETEQLLISCRGANSGKVNFSPPNCFITNNSLVVRLPGDDPTLKRFYFYFLHQVDKQGLVTGSAQPQVTINNAVEIRLPLPPLNEQKRIVAKIEELFTKLDAGVEALETAKALLKKYRQSVLQAAVTGKLTEKWREEHQGEIDDKETSNDQAHPWKSDVLGNLSNLITKGESPKWQGFDYVDDGIPFIRSENVLWGKFDPSKVVKIPNAFHAKLKRSQLQPGDLLVNLVGASIGRCAILPKTVSEGNINQAVALVRTNQRLNPDFLLIYLLAPQTQATIASSKVETARPNISLTDLRNLECPIPSLAEQQILVGEVESLMSIADNAENLFSKELLKSGFLRQSILKQAFEGKLVPQDPNDEPAERLLERIPQESPSSAKGRKGKRLKEAKQ